MVRPFLISLLLLSSFVFSQSKLDSLKKELAKNASADSAVADLSYKIAYELKDKDATASLRYVHQAISTAKKLDEVEFLNGCYLLAGLNHKTIGNTDSAFYYYNLTIEGATKSGDTYVLANVNLNLGNIYRRRGDFRQALKHVLEAERNYKLVNNKSGLASVYNNFALLYEDMLDKSKAEEYYRLSLSTAIAIHDTDAIGRAYLNMGNIQTSKNYKKALEYYQKSMDMAKRSGDKYRLSTCLLNIGSVYDDQGNLDLAKEYYLKAYKLKEEIRHTYGIAMVMDNLAQVYLKLGDLKKAHEAAERSLEYAQISDDIYLVKNAYESLSDVYDRKGDYKQALFYYRKLKHFGDSIFNSDNRAEIQKLQSTFDEKRKDQEIILLNKDKELQAEQLKEQKLVTYSIIGIAALVSLLALALFLGFRNKKKANELLSRQKTEIEKQKDIIDTQKHIVEEKNKEVTDSINYAKRIQYALLANEKMMKANLGEHFILFKPKDIVSGDFYWATETADGFYLGVCDSTGHGVPGAFMSLLSIGFLSEAIKEKDIHDPNLVLDYVRGRLELSISSEGQRDGFDGILIKVDKKTRKMTYAAANNNPVVIRETFITELEADKMPVGMGEKKESFNLYTIEAGKGAMLYLYTDGYPDQFGGPKGKKFKYKQLNELLQSISHKPMQEQMDILDSVFQEWKGSLEQVDDVCIIGLKL